MSFRHRLALFLVVTLVAVQAATALMIYGYLRHDLVERAKRELAAEAGEFGRQLDFLSSQVKTDVELLALDYPLHSAIAKNDHETVSKLSRDNPILLASAMMCWSIALPMPFLLWS